MLITTICRIPQVILLSLLHFCPFISLYCQHPSQARLDSLLALNSNTFSNFSTSCINNHLFTDTIISQFSHFNIHWWRLVLKNWSLSSSQGVILSTITHGSPAFPLSVRNHSFDEDLEGCMWPVSALSFRSPLLFLSLLCITELVRMLTLSLPYSGAFVFVLWSAQVFSSRNPGLSFFHSFSPQSNVAFLWKSSVVIMFRMSWPYHFSRLFSFSHTLPSIAPALTSLPLYPSLYM